MSPVKSAGETTTEKRGWLRCGVSLYNSYASISFHRDFVSGLGSVASTLQRRRLRAAGSGIKRGGRQRRKSGEDVTERRGPAVRRLR